jgi:hypothetical protein
VVEQPEEVATPRLARMKERWNEQERADPLRCNEPLKTPGKLGDHRCTRRGVRTITGLWYCRDHYYPRRFAEENRRDKVRGLFDYPPHFSSYERKRRMLLLGEAVALEERVLAAFQDKPQRRLLPLITPVVRRRQRRLAKALELL